MDTVQVKVKLQVKDTKDKTLVQVVEFVYGFEGGQTPLFRRLPKRGFTNINRKEYAIVNLDQLNKFEDGTVVTAELLLETGVIKKLHSGLKVLGQGQLEKKLTVKAAKFSKTAEEQIAAQGGSIEVV